MIFTVRSGKSIGDVRQAFEEAAAANRFGLLGFHDIAERLRAKGFSFDRKLYVYEICNPAAAKTVLDAGMRFASALPCRVAIYTDGGEVVLETIRPTAVMKMFDEPALMATAAEIDAAVETVMRKAAA